ncbi:MAG: ribonuclease III [Endomicrobiaceae bacterium]|nr:ribonuclease III [Endomicrobiaceae bacterium]MDD3053295.1 ribonuclease III [Endomicrobiaceae bacterium]
MLDNLKILQGNLGYQFKNQDYLKLALTHRSYSSEYGLKDCNERMEFLGDSILSAIVAEFLYDKYVNDNEGKLSQLKSQIVSAKNLSKWAKNINLDKFILISKSEELNSARNRDTLLCDSFEAIIGAIYLDSDFLITSDFIKKFLSSQKKFVVVDYKSTLQEKVQSEFQTLPQYKVLKEYGPDHDKKFEVGVYINESLLGIGVGISKKEAEQMSAKQASKKLKK